MSETTAVVDETKTETPVAEEETHPETAAPAADGEQQQLFQDETKEEEDVREVLISMQPHEVLEAVDRIVALNQEVNEQEREEEREKTRHKEAKDKTTANIEAARQKLSKLIEQTGLKKKKETRNTRKVINFTTKQVQWFLRETDELVDERPMVAGEYQVKLALQPAAVGVEDDDNAEDGGELGNASRDAAEVEGDAQGVDPATMDEPASTGDMGGEEMVEAEDA